MTPPSAPSPRSSPAARRLVAGAAALATVVSAGLVTALPARADQATPAVVDSTVHDGRYLSLTFDDGPDPVSTPALLAVLKKHHVKATFCLWGDHVQQHPEVVRQIAADGHRLCNHTMHHDDMADWDADAIRQDLEQTSAAIRAAVPGARIDYFRAPTAAGDGRPRSRPSWGCSHWAGGSRSATGRLRARPSWCAASRRASRPGPWSCCTTAAATAARPSRPWTR
ncbi:polysaccharide deacetylase family protein [Kocuria sp. CNJ-770]|uniref:polysaccharide deacetylase family protein n=1 Tax=Kocuria sp. CNJ-770 TaxID=1904964 RepID=UPI002101CCA0|nr:polysaccharide deacetylase family protein [Kocuria sp. CNJ-770]